MAAQSITEPMETQAQEIQQAIPRSHYSLDDVISESERRQKERIILRMEDFTYKQRLAKLFAASGLFGDIKGSFGSDQAIAQAFVKIELGESMGFTPAESMQGIDIIQGRPAVGAGLRSARMKAGGYDWRFARHDDKGCKILLFKDGKPILNADGTQAAVEFNDADAAHIMKGRDGAVKDNWRNHPKNMYFARAITNAQRWYAPEVLNPRILSEEEAIDLEDVVEATERRTYETPDSAQAAAATTAKTETLSEKLRAKRTAKSDAPQLDQNAMALAAPPAVKAAAIMPAAPQPAATMTTEGQEVMF